MPECSPWWRCSCYWYPLRPQYNSLHSLKHFLTHRIQVPVWSMNVREGVKSKLHACIFSVWWPINSSVFSLWYREWSTVCHSHMWLKDIARCCVCEIIRPSLYRIWGRGQKLSRKIVSMREIDHVLPGLSMYFRAGFECYIALQAFCLSFFTYLKLFYWFYSRYVHWIMGR